MTPQNELKVATAAEVRTELGLVEPAAIQIHPGDAQDLESKADHFVDRLTALDPRDPEQGKASVETMAMDLQRKAAKQLSLMNQPLKTLSTRGEEGGDVATALIDLKVKVEELDPGKFDLEPGWFSRALGRLPGVGTPINRYFSKFESAQTVISAIVHSLEQGKDQLSRDNITLGEDQRQMREMGRKLEQAIQLGKLIDQKLQYKLEREIQTDDPRHRFIAEELLFPLRQRLIDLQQQLAVHQQGVLATEIIVRNNKELIRGVDRALNVTVVALQVGATVAMALANQKIVLDKVQSVNDTTSALIAGTAARLKTQGMEIHKQATSAQLSMDALKSAFTDIKAAIDDLSNFRQQALPQMAATVLELDQVTSEADQAIRTMEEGNRARPDIRIDVD